MIAHVRNEFEFTVHAPYQVVGAVVWTGGRAGLVGRTLGSAILVSAARAGHAGRGFHHPPRPSSRSLDQHGLRHVRPTIINTLYFIPETMVVLIDVRFSELDAENTKVNVAYERTALNPEANEHVKEMGRVGP